MLGDWETPEEEISRLERERHMYSETFKHTGEEDTVTRAHLQSEMDRRTRRIIQLQEQPDGLGLVGRAVCVLMAAAAGYGVWTLDITWLRWTLGVLAAVLALMAFA